jgi:hypothetical protein
MNIAQQTLPLFALKEQSEVLAEKLYSILDVPPFDNTNRVRFGTVSYSMSLEH